MHERLLTAQSAYTYDREGLPQRKTYSSGSFGFLYEATDNRKAKNQRPSLINKATPQHEENLHMLGRCFIVQAKTFTRHTVF
jgi:hypothetical protein